MLATAFRIFAIALKLEMILTILVLVLAVVRVGAVGTAVESEDGEEDKDEGDNEDIDEDKNASSVGTASETLRDLVLSKPAVIRTVSVRPVTPCAGLPPEISVILNQQIPFVKQSSWWVEQILASGSTLFLLQGTISVCPPKTTLRYRREQETRKGANRIAEGVK